MEYDLPRAELCCEIGTCFLEQKAYRQAIYWYEQALNTPREDEKCGVVIPDCYGYIPAIQLCVCYDSIGYYVIARKYNDLAGKFRPDSEEYQYNLNYFLSLEK